MNARLDWKDRLLGTLAALLIWGGLVVLGGLLLAWPVQVVVGVLKGRR